jgi:hypothetical protein
LNLTSTTNNGTSGGGVGSGLNINKTLDSETGASERMIGGSSAANPFMPHSSGGEYMKKKKSSN